MKKNLILSTLAIALTLNLTAQADNGPSTTLYERAFPYTDDTATGMMAFEVQFGLTSVATVGRSYFNQILEERGRVLPAKEGMELFLREETRRLAIEDLRQTDPQLHQLLVNRDEAQQAWMDARRKINEIDEKHGPNLGNTLEDLNDPRYKQILQERTELQLSIPKLEEAMIDAGIAARPANAKISMMRDEMTKLSRI